MEALHFGVPMLISPLCNDQFHQARFSTAPFTTVCGGADPFIGERGGRHLLGGHRWAGAVVDVGQSRIKISLANRRFMYPRDFDGLPVRSDSPTHRGGVEKG